MEGSIIRKNIYSHLIGGCTRIYNDALVNIPKNASTLIVNWSHEQTDPNIISEANYLDFEVDKYYVLIRDPFDRWISGVTEYYYRQNKQNKVEIKDLFDRIDMIEFDEHTAPQYQFLNFDYTKNTVFVPMNKKGIHYLNKKFLKYPHHPKKVWESASIDTKVRIQRLLLEKVQKQPSLKDKVMIFYKQDYKIIENYFPHIGLP